jgi:hypothetical protein
MRPEDRVRVVVGAADQPLEVVLGDRERRG